VFRSHDSGFRVDSGFREACHVGLMVIEENESERLVQILEPVWGLSFRDEGSGFRAEGLGFGV